MRILITGGAGLIGSRAAEFYAKKGDEVIILDNLERSKLFNSKEETVTHNLNWLKQFSNIQYIEGDVCNKKDVKQAFGEGVDAVIHTAGQPGIRFSVQFPKKDFNINALGTLNTLECIRQVCPDATFVYCSTNKVYGENVNRILIRELDTRYEYRFVKGVAEHTDVDQTGHSLYGVSKYIGDLYVQEYAYSYGIKTAVFRMSCIYGTRQFGFEDQGWIAWFIISMLQGNIINIYGNGKQVRDALYVDDVVKAYDAFIKSDIPHGVWNIGGGIENSVSLLELVAFLEEELSIKALLTFKDWRPFDQKIYISDINKVSKDLCWYPKISINTGCRKLIKWLKDR